MEAEAGNSGGRKSAQRHAGQDAEFHRAAACGGERDGFLQEHGQVERLSASFWEELTRRVRELTRIDGRVIITNENVKTQRKRKDI